MPRSVVLPEAARHMSANAAPQMRNELDQFPAPFESFSVLYYGVIEGDDIRGFLWETDRDTWIENPVGGGQFTYQELSDTGSQVVLYDASRDRTVTIDWPTNDVTVLDDGTEQTFDVIDFAHSLWP